MDTVSPFSLVASFVSLWIRSFLGRQLKNFGM